MHKANFQRCLIAAVLTTGVLGSRPAFAMRYVKFEIIVDKKIVLMTSKGDSGSEDPSVMYGYLKDMDLRPVNGYQLKPTKSPLKAVLKGKIHIDCNNGPDVTVNELKLVRSKVDSKWKVDPLYVKRFQQLLHTKKPVKAR